MFVAMHCYTCEDIDTGLIDTQIFDTYDEAFKFLTDYLKTVMNKEFNKYNWEYIKEELKTRAYCFYTLPNQHGEFDKEIIRIKEVSK